MRSTIFFISMLIFVSCSQNLFEVPATDATDAKFIELSKNPSSEAVFATMSMQLQTEGGFNRVLGLLNQLIHDGKKQLHQITKTWRRVNARCQVSKYMLHGRQEFFANTYARSNRRLINARLRLGEAKDHLAANNESIRVYNNILKAEISRHSIDGQRIKRRSALTQAGTNALDAAIKEVQNWTPRGAALIQTSFRDISAAFAEVGDYEIATPVELIQTAGNDHKVRRRLVQWLAILRVQLLGLSADLKNLATRRSKLNANIEKALAALVAALTRANRGLNHLIVVSGQQIKNNEALLQLYGKLVAQNRALIVANRNYCNTEAANYGKNKARIQQALVLFRDIRHEFVKNYSRIHSFIRAKFNHKN